MNEKIRFVNLSKGLKFSIVVFWISVLFPFFIVILSFIID